MDTKYNRVKFFAALSSVWMLSALQAFSQESAEPDYASMAKRPDIVSAGEKLPYRNNIIPYPTAEEALQGAGSSAYVIPMLQWERDTVSGGVRYRGRFKVRYSWDDRAVIFRLEDASSSFSLAVNGQKAGYSQNGAGRSEFDITEWIVPDYNEVAVTVYDEAAARCLQGEQESSRVDLGEAYIVSQPAVRVQDIAISTSADDKFGHIALDVVMKSILLNPKDYTVFYELLDPTGETAAMSQKTFTTSMKSCDTVRFVVRVPDPMPWNHESPNLYTLLIKTQNEGRFREYIRFKIGFRNASHDDRGRLTIDGLPVPLHAVRYAANESEALTSAKLEKLRASGYNCIVANGGPQPDYLYRLCDSLGIYVCDAAAIDTSMQPSRLTKGGNPSNDPAWKESYIDRIHAMYYSSAIHPSVVMLSPARNSFNGYCLYESYMELKRVAPGAAVFYGEADGQWNNDIDERNLFTPPVARSAASSRVSVAVERNSASLAVVLANNSALTTARGTIKVTVKSGRKTLSSEIGEFSIAGGGEYTQSVEIPADISRGSVSVEVSVLRDRPSDNGSGRSRVADMYEVSKHSFDL